LYLTLLKKEISFLITNSNIETQQSQLSCGSFHWRYTSNGRVWAVKNELEGVWKDAYVVYLRHRSHTCLGRPRATHNVSVQASGGKLDELCYPRFGTQQPCLYSCQTYGSNTAQSLTGGS